MKNFGYNLIPLQTYSSFILGLIFICPLFCLQLLQAQDSSFKNGMPATDLPIEVDIGFSLIKLTDVNEREETIDFEGAFYLRWLDQRLAYDQVEAAMPDFVSGNYDQVPRRIYQGIIPVTWKYDGWRPHIVIANGIGNRDPSNMSIKIWPDGQVEYVEVFHAKVETSMDLRKFPFDKQRLQIFLHPFLYNTDQIILVPNENLSREWNQDFGIAEWEQNWLVLEEKAFDIERFDQSIDRISQFVVTAQLERKPRHVLINVLLPLLILVSLVWCVFWIKQDKPSDRISILFIGILSVVTFYFVIQGSVPEIDYLTLVDIHILLTFFILAAGVIITVYGASLQQKGKIDRFKKLDRISRRIFPLGYLLVSVLIYLIFG